MSHFNERHYEAIALIFQQEKPKPNWDANKLAQWTVMLNAFSEMLARDNSRFKLGRFERACEPGANVRART
jgi:hypothetical protein